MIKKVSTICLLLITLPHVMGIRSADASYESDKRRYIGSINNEPYNTDAAHPTISWSMFPYNQIVKICNSEACGTGTFVSPAHILTNKHVAECCGVEGTSMARDNCNVYTHDNQKLLASTVISGGGTAANIKKHCKFRREDLYGGTDWAIIELVSTDAVRKHGYDFIDWYNPLYWQPILGYRTSIDFRAGFGALRVLSDQDIRNIKAAYENALKQVRAPQTINPDNSDGVDLYQDGTSFWDIYDEDNPDKQRRAEYLFRGFFDAYQAKTGKDFLTDTMEDGLNLKIIEKCDIYRAEYDDGYNIQVYPYDEHLCTQWGGDSGSTLIKHQLEPKILSLTNAGPYTIPGTSQYPSYEHSVPIDLIFTQEVQDMLNFTRNNDKKAGDPCEPFHLKQVNATAGVYVTGGSNHLYCANLTPCSCAATECMKGFVMAKDARGYDMGYCVWGGSATSTAANQTINTNAAAPNSTSNTAVPALIAAGSTAAVVAATIAGTIAGGKNTARRAYSQQTNIAANGTTAQNIVATPQNNARTIGANCAADDMPANAERGEYAAVSIKKLDCAGQQCACVATKCKNGYKLVYKQINGKWESMGYCIKPKPCTTGQHDTDVIDGIEIIRQHGGKFCK